MFKNLRNMVFDKSFKITIYEHRVNINNYSDVLLFTDEEVLITVENKIIKVKGSDLIITRLENNEMLIDGHIKLIDLGD